VNVKLGCLNGNPCRHSLKGVLPEAIVSADIRIRASQHDVKAYDRNARFVGCLGVTNHTASGAAADCLVTSKAVPGANPPSDFMNVSGTLAEFSPKPAVKLDQYVVIFANLSMGMVRWDK
jgi:hypothetical protein